MGENPASCANAIAVADCGEQGKKLTAGMQRKENDGLLDTVTGETAYNDGRPYDAKCDAENHDE